MPLDHLSEKGGAGIPLALTRAGTTYPESGHPDGVPAYEATACGSEPDLLIHGDGISGWGPREMVVGALRRSGTLVTLSDGTSLFVRMPPEDVSAAIEGDGKR